MWLKYIILFYHNRSCFGNVYPYASELKSRIQETNCLILFIQLLSNLISTFIPNKFPVNIFTLFVIIQYYFIANTYFDANSHWPESARACPPTYSRFCYFRLVYGKWKYSRVLIFFSMIFYQVKFNHRLRTTYHSCENTKGLSCYSGAGVL